MNKANHNKGKAGGASGCTTRRSAARTCAAMDSFSLPPAACPAAPGMTYVCSLPMSVPVPTLAFCCSSTVYSCLGPATAQVHRHASGGAGCPTGMAGAAPAAERCDKERQGSAQPRPAPPPSPPHPPTSCAGQSPRASRCRWAGWRRSQRPPTRTHLPGSPCPPGPRPAGPGAGVGGRVCVCGSAGSNGRGSVGGCEQQHTVSWHNATAAARQQRAAQAHLLLFFLLLLALLLLRLQLSPPHHLVHGLQAHGKRARDAGCGGRTRACHGTQSRLRHAPKQRSPWWHTRAWPARTRRTSSSSSTSSSSTPNTLP